MQLTEMPAGFNTLQTGAPLSCQLEPCISAVQRCPMNLFVEAPWNTKLA